MVKITSFACDDGGVAPQDGWAAVNTQPHRERVALENLLRQGFNAYCPLIRKRVRHARSAQDALRPLFPSYLFVRFELERRSWRPILSTFGVRTLVRCGDRPSRVAPDFVEALKSREIDGAITPPTKQLYQVGRKVQLTGGFDGVVATIIELDERDRIVVLLDMLGREVKVRLSASQAVPV